MLVVVTAIAVAAVLLGLEVGQAIIVWLLAVIALDAIGRKRTKR